LTSNAADYAVAAEMGSGGCFAGGAPGAEPGVPGARSTARDAKAAGSVVFHFTVDLPAVAVSWLELLQRSASMESEDWNARHHDSHHRLFAGTGANPPSNRLDKARTHAALVAYDPIL